MASAKPVVIEYSVFGELLPVLSPVAQDVYGCLLNNGIYAFHPIVIWISMWLKPHLVAIMDLFELYSSRAHRLLMWTFVLAMKLPAQASINSFSLGSIQHLFQTLWNVIAMWSSTPFRNRQGQTNFALWPLLLLRMVSCQGWIFSICTGTQNENLTLGLNFLICPMEMI